MSNEHVYDLSRTKTRRKWKSAVVCVGVCVGACSPVLVRHIWCLLLSSLASFLFTHKHKVSKTRDTFVWFARAFHVRSIGSSHGRCLRQQRIPFVFVFNKRNGFRCIESAHFSLYLAVVIFIFSLIFIIPRFFSFTNNHIVKISAFIYVYIYVYIRTYIFALVVLFIFIWFMFVRLLPFFRASHVADENRHIRSLQFARAVPWGGKESAVCR